MDVIPSIILDDTSVLAVRPPLAPRNSSTSPTPITQVKRKPSIVRRANSSEEIPSPHSSIFEAIRFSNKGSEESGYDATLSPGGVTNENYKVSSPSAGGQRNLEVHDEVAGLSVSEATEFLYGHGTMLDTITEQKSIGTMNTNISTTTDHSPTRPLLNHHESFHIAKSPRRRLSLSLDDIVKINRSYHDACASIEAAIGKSFEIHDIYVQPKRPIQPPPKRPRTPPGMPSWTAAQTVPRNRLGGRLITRPSLLQRLFCISTTTSQADSIDSEPLAPRFRPPRTVYPQLREHPFNRPPTVKSDPYAMQLPVPASRIPIPSGSPRRYGRREYDHRVRFTPSATARDSEIRAIENTVGVSRRFALDPFTLIALPEQQCLCSHQRRRAAKSAPSGIGTSAIVPPSTAHDNNLSSTAPSAPPPSTTQPSPRLISRPSILSGQLTNPTIRYNSDSNITTSTTPPNPFMSGAITPVDSLNPTTTSSPPLVSAQSPTVHPGPQIQTTQEQQLHTSTCWRCKFRTHTKSFKIWMDKQGHKFCFYCCGWDSEDTDVNEAVNVVEMRESRRYDGF